MKRIFLSRFYMMAWLLFDYLAYMWTVNWLLVHSGHTGGGLYTVVISMSIGLPMMWVLGMFRRDIPF